MAWPTLERLSRLASPSAAAALYRYAELMRPSHMTPANDNDPDGDEMDAEFRHEFRPTISEMMRAATTGSRTFVRFEKRGATWEKDRHIVESQAAQLKICGSDIRLGDLIFRSGKLVRWGETDNGRELKPIERQRMPRGTARQARTESAIRFLVRTDAPIAKGAYWFGGRKGKKGITTRPDVGDHDAAVELARNQRRAAVRLVLGDKVWVLDAAITDSTAREIGQILGYTGKTAERRGIAAINDAIEEFQQIAA